jgi:hypothetical protein
MRRSGRPSLPRRLGTAVCIGFVGALAGCVSLVGRPAYEPAGAGKDGVSTVFVPALPPPLATHCASKADGREAAPARLERQLDPLDAPALFTRHFFPDRESGEQGFIELGAAHYRTLAQWADEPSGLHTALLLNPDNGHGVLMFRGVARVGSDPGGVAAFLRDSRILLAAKADRQNPQLLAGEAFFHRARCEPEVRSLEIIGYSLGSQVANALAVRQRAIGTVFADMGLDISIIERDAQADKAALRQELRQHLRSLRLSGDLLVRVYAVGETIGERIDLPGGVVGLLHQPEIYVNSANLARGVPPSP